MKFHYVTNLPILLANGPNMIVPIIYEMLAGRNATPCSHFSAFMIFSIKVGNVGSRVPIPILANISAPETRIKKYRIE